MLKRLHLRNFTVFEDANFEFGEGLNVIVGANGTGKSHVLKAGYVMRHGLTGFLAEIRDETITKQDKDSLLEGFLFDRLLLLVFQPSPFKVGPLIRQGSEMNQAEINVTASSYHGQVSTSIVFTHFYFKRLPEIWQPHAEKNTQRSDPDFYYDPVFIPAKEVLTMGWLYPLYNRFDLPIDASYTNLLELLMGPPLRQPEPAHIVAQLQQLIGGKVEEEGGHFYLAAPEQPRMEMNLVAEGVRKFATLYKLLANGTLTPETTLFWDEPEANLNPLLLKEMAAVLTELAKAGFQIILATHSLFLLKELHILAQRERKPVRYFGLSAENGGPTQVATADALTDLPNIVALDAEMAQSDTFLDVLNQNDADV